MRYLGTFSSVEGISFNKEKLIPLKANAFPLDFIEVIIDSQFRVSRFKISRVPFHRGIRHLINEVRALLCIKVFFNINSSEVARNAKRQSLI